MWAELMSQKLGCKLVGLPANYLGIPLGANARRLSTWSLVINKVRKKLGTWKSKVLSKADRLV